jgi:glycosyltransferase involved in cell wall biosynthesis
MRKVLLVYFEPQASGQTTHVLSLVNGLNKEKYAITVVLPSHLLRSISAFRQTGVTVIPLPMSKFLWHPDSIVSFVHLIREQEFDIVHVHSQEAGLIVRIFARAAGAKKIIYTPQCTSIRHSNWLWLYRSIEKILSFITDKIISVSEIDRIRIIQWGIPVSKVITVNNGIDLGLTNDPVDVPAWKEMLDLDGQDPIVMQVGRLTYQKDPLSFIEGAAQVIGKIPKAQFLLVGEGPLMDDVENTITDLGIQGNVRCLGRRDNADKLIAIADVVTLTSRWEGLPYVLLEAMAWSRPVVTTAVNGCTELVENGVTGFLVPKGDVTSWANCVIEILEDPQGSIEMGQNGNKRLKDRFSLEKMIAQIEGLYEELTLNPAKI